MSTATLTKKKNSKAKKATRAAARELKEALGEMTEALRDKVDSILRRCAELDSADIEKRYEIGRDINEVIEDKTGKFGVEPKQTMMDALRLSKDSVGWMMRVAAAFTPSDLSKLTALKNKENGETLRWNHIVFLARVPDKEMAFGFAHKAVELGWTTKDLGRTIIEHAGGAKSKGGRKSRIHHFANFETAIADVEKKSRNTADVAEKVWLGPGGVVDLFQQRAQRPGYRASEEDLKQIEQAYAQLQRLSTHTMVASSTLMSIKMQAEASRRSKLVA